MTSVTDDTYTAIAIPGRTSTVVGVYVDGVRLPDSDYEVLSDRICLATPLKRRSTTSGIGKLLLSVGIGVYNRGEIVDVEVRRGDRTLSIRGRPFDAAG